MLIQRVLQLSTFLTDAFTDNLKGATTAKEIDPFSLMADLLTDITEGGSLTPSFLVLQVDGTGYVLPTISTDCNPLLRRTRGRSAGP